MFKGFITGIIIWMLLLGEITLSIKGNEYKWHGIRYYMNKKEK